MQNTEEKEPTPRQPEILSVKCVAGMCRQLALLIIKNGETNGFDKWLSDIAEAYAALNDKNQEQRTAITELEDELAQRKWLAEAQPLADRLAADREERDHAQLLESPFPYWQTLRTQCPKHIPIEAEFVTRMDDFLVSQVPQPKAQAE